MTTTMTLGIFKGGISVENNLVLSIDVITGKSQVMWCGEGETCDSLEETKELLQTLLEELPLEEGQSLYE